MVLHVKEEAEDDCKMLNGRRSIFGTSSKSVPFFEPESSKFFSRLLVGYLPEPFFSPVR